jgi:hypothetical protein
MVVYGSGSGAFQLRGASARFSSASRKILIAAPARRCGLPQRSGGPMGWLRAYPALVSPAQSNVSPDCCN